jgi:hypothetical protein
MNDPSVIEMDELMLATPLHGTNTRPSESLQHTTSETAPKCWMKHFDPFHDSPFDCRA